MVLPILCLLLVTLPILAADPALLQYLFAPQSKPQARPTTVVTTFTPANLDEQKALTTAQYYMTAFIKHDYQAMWTVLHPQMREKWSGEAAFSAFWQARFHDFALEDFQTGKIQRAAEWVDPESMLVYNHVVKILVSLQLEPSPQYSAAPFVLLRIRVDGRESLAEFKGSMPW